MILYFFFTEVKCKGNCTQITYMEETEKRHRVIRLMSCMKMFDSTAGLGKEAAVFFLLVWRWVKVENAVSLSLENACTNIRSCGKWYAYYYLLLPPTAECQLPLSFPEPPFYSKEVFVCNKMPLTFAWLVEIKSMTLSQCIHW